MKFEVSAKIKDLNIKVDNITDEMQEKLNVAVKSLSYEIYNQGITYAHQRLNSTYQQYASGFHWKDLGDNIYLIYLDDEVAHLEGGYPSWDMKPSLINGPKSKAMKNGGRYNTVPFKHSIGGKTPLSKAEIDIKASLKDVIKQYGLNKTFKDKEGKPLEGVVARIKGKDMSANLRGLIKVQKTYAKKTESTYMTFRRVSSNSSPSSWIHPGFKGAHVFKDLEAWTERKITEIISVILS